MIILCCQVTNLHLDTNEHFATRAKELFLMFDLLQYVDVPTHKLGHTLDSVLARSDSPIISDIFPNNVLLSDHFMVCFNVLVSAPKIESKIVRYRNLKDVDFEQFKRESKEGICLREICSALCKITILLCKP